MPDRARGGITAAYEFDGPLRRALHRAKYRGQPGLASALGGLLADVPEFCAPGWDAIVPVPLHRWRLLTRGYNQSALLVASAARRGGFRRRVDPSLLVRRGSGLAQARLRRRQRKRNVAAAFEVPARRARVVAGRRILVVDDVTTTGATLHACVLALRRAGARDVGALALMRALP